MIVCSSFYTNFWYFRYVFVFIIPELEQCLGFDQQHPYHCHSLYRHIAFALGYKPSDIITKLTLLFHDIGKPKAFFMGDDGFGHFYGHPDISVEIAEEVLKRLKYSNEIIDETLWLVKYHDNDYIPNKKSVLFSFLLYCIIWYIF